MSKKEIEMKEKILKESPVKEISIEDLRIEIYKDGCVVIIDTTGDMFRGAFEISKEDMELIIKEYKELIKE